MPSSGFNQLEELVPWRTDNIFLGTHPEPRAAPRPRLEGRPQAAGLRPFAAKQKGARRRRSGRRRRQQEKEFCRHLQQVVRKLKLPASPPPPLSLLRCQCWQPQPLDFKAWRFSASQLGVQIICLPTAVGYTAGLREFLHPRPSLLKFALFKKRVNILVNFKCLKWNSVQNKLSTCSSLGSVYTPVHPWQLF